MNGLPELCPRCEALLREHFENRGVGLEDEPLEIQDNQRLAWCAAGGAADALNHLMDAPAGDRLDWPIPPKKDYHAFRSALYKLASYRGLRLHMTREGRELQLWMERSGKHASAKLSGRR